MRMDRVICAGSTCEDLLAGDAMAFILAGGRGSRLKELTDGRAKPAVPFGGRFRIIDFALSNAINSGIRRIGVATQYRHDSLIRHLERVSGMFHPARGGSFDCLPGSPHPAGPRHYRSTAAAVLQNIDLIQRHAPRHIVVLAGDHIYKMDYEAMLRQHVDAGADVTVGCLTVPREEATGFGVMSVDARDRITAFVEKPQNPPAMPDKPGFSLASMGIYVFDTAFLLEELRRDAGDADSTHDFGGDIIPHIVRHGKAVAHRFATSCVRTEGETGDYWRDVGTLDAFFDANLDMVSAAAPFVTEDGDWPIWTDRPRFSAMHRRHAGRARETSLFNWGDETVPGLKTSDSLIFDDVDIGSRSRLDEAIVLPGCRIGPDVRLSRVIVDAGVHIPAGLVIGEDPELDARRFRRTGKGVCLITQAMIDRLAERPGMRSAA